MGVFIASLPALRPVFSPLTELAARLLSRRPSSYERTKPKRNSFQRRQNSLNMIDAHPEHDADGLNLIPMNNIVTMTNMDRFGQ